MAWYNFHYQKGGGGIIINRIFKAYSIKYIGSDKSQIQYIKPVSFNISYLNKTQNIKIQYIGSDESLIEYKTPNKIKIKYNDNNN
jgi:hypothetical protein